MGTPGGVGSTSRAPAGAQFGGGRVRVVMSGSTGLIGTAVARELEAAGHTVVRLVRRRPAGPHEVSWDPERSGLDAAALRGAGGVIHLAGEPIAEGRWTRERK